MELSQELISVAVIFSVCVILAFCCMCIWMCRCRQDQIRATEEKNDRAVQLQNFEQEQAKNGGVQASLKPGKRLEINDVERSSENLRSHRELQQHQLHHSRETIGQHEERVSSGKPSSHQHHQQQQQRAAGGVAQRFRDEEAAKNKRLDTISEIALSNDSLQRNDSKTNVFNNGETRSKGSSCDVDLNPGLNSSINLEKI